MKYRVKTLNNISDIINTKLRADRYDISDEETNPDAILVRSAAMHDMEFGPELLAIGRAGAGVNNIPVDVCADKGIVVFNTPGANANAVAELVMAALLLTGRDVISGIQWARTLRGKGAEVAKLVEKGKSQFTGPEVRGKTLGVLGLGGIGAIVANAASRGLKMRVLGYDPFISAEQAWKLSTSVEKAGSLDELLAQSDFLTVHIPLNDKTRGTFNASSIGKMQDGAVLLNFSRGEIADAQAVLDALHSGKLRRYVTDFPCDELLDEEKAVCIPHLGASTPESEENCAGMAAEEIRDYLETGSILHSVNYPDIALDRPDGVRLIVLHENVPNMVNSISAVVSEESINIEAMQNKSRQSKAVTVMELSGRPSDKAQAKLGALEGVHRVRVL